MCLAGMETTIRTLLRQREKRVIVLYGTPWSRFLLKLADMFRFPRAPSARIRALRQSFRSRFA